MTDKDVTLRFGGGGSLTFADASGARHRVVAGETFRTDPTTAALLLEDGSVTRPDAAPRLAAVPDPSTDPTEPTDIGTLTKAQLLDRAAGLGLTVPKRATNRVIVEAIEEAEAAQTVADLDEGDTTAPADDPDAVSSEESGMPPEGDEDAETSAETPSTEGAISLGDLPPGARLAPDHVG